jgi:hypothetical protein
LHVVSNFDEFWPKKIGFFFFFWRFFPQKTGEITTEYSFFKIIFAKGWKFATKRIKKSTGVRTQERPPPTSAPSNKGRFVGPLPRGLFAPLIVLVVAAVALAALLVAVVRGVRCPCGCLFVAYVCNLACRAPSITLFSLLLLRLSSSLQLATRKTQAKLITFHERSI